MSIHEDNVCEKIQTRAQFGLKKYGVTLEREDLTLRQWFVHLQEELMDACAYVEVVLSKIDSAGIGDEVLENKDFSGGDLCQIQNDTEALK